MPNFHRASSATELARILALFVAARLREGLARRGQALLVVSGGATPLPFFEALSQQPLDWSAVHVLLADERWVPPEHEHSNERLLRAHLLQGPAAAAPYTPLFLPGADARTACGVLNQTLAALPWPADLVVLGMGSDGHTASLFPDAGAWPHGPGERCLYVPAPEAPNVPLPRVSLSPEALRDARCTVVHIVGEAKLKVLTLAMKPGPVEAMPIRLALHGGVQPCEVFCTG